MKMESSKTWIILPILAFLTAVSSIQAQVTLVSTGAVWKYLDDGSQPEAAWYSPDFGDETWNSGPAELGFGDGFEATTNTAGFITYYYRHAFDVTDATSITNMRVRLKRDDGAVIYLNGAEL